MRRIVFLLLPLALMLGCGKDPVAFPDETPPAPAGTASVNPDQPSGADAIRTVPVTIQDQPVFTISATPEGCQVATAFTY